MGARIYVPQLGRFLQPDPVYGGSANAYEYAYQDPVNKLDLDGRCVSFLSFLRKKCVEAASRAVGGLVRVTRGGGVGTVRRGVIIEGRRRVVHLDVRASQHALNRIFDHGRAVSLREMRRTIGKGTVHWDPKNKGYSFFRKRKDGKYTHVALDPLSGHVKTVNVTRRIPKRMQRIK